MFWTFAITGLSFVFTVLLLALVGVAVGVVFVLGFGAAIALDFFNKLIQVLLEVMLKVDRRWQGASNRPHGLRSHSDIRKRVAGASCSSRHKPGGGGFSGSGCGVHGESGCFSKPLLLWTLVCVPIIAPEGRWSARRLHDCSESRHCGTGRAQKFETDSPSPPHGLSHKAGMTP